MENLEKLQALIQTICSHVDAVKQAKRDAELQIRSLDNLRVAIADHTYSHGPTEAQKELLRATKSAMRDAVEADGKNRVAEQRNKSAIAIDCLRVELCRLAAAATIELGQVAKAMREQEATP